MPPSPNAALNAVFTAFVLAQPSLLRHVNASFPDLCCGHTEDAVSAVGLALVMNPTYYVMVHDPQNPERLYGLFKRVAWRAARNIWRRPSYSAERTFEHEDDAHLGREATQTLELALGRDHKKLVRQEAEKVSSRHAERLVAAYEDQRVNGGTDGEVAERHGTRREYLNRLGKNVDAHFIGERRRSRRRAQNTV